MHTQRILTDTEGKVLRIEHTTPQKGATNGPQYL
jgi:hypothetical protein